MSDNQFPADATIIDVRTPEEFAQERVKKAINIDLFSPSFMLELQKLDQSKSYLLYCRSGNRSGQAEQIMRQIGFLKVQNIGGLAEVRDLFGTEFP